MASWFGVPGWFVWAGLYPLIRGLVLICAGYMNTCSWYSPHANSRCAGGSSCALTLHLEQVVQDPVWICQTCPNHTQNFGGSSTALLARHGESGYAGPLC